ncbi:MAG TPA: class I tRNA ligase family protein [Thermoplasmata archaeon]|nr:class I tRNA ligase family protein [Thermoplasmata archaeon]
MVDLSETYDPAACERDAQSLWAGRRFRAPDGTVGAGEGPRVWQFEGTFAPGDRPELVAQRAVAADVDARYLAIAGRRAVGTLRGETFRGVNPSPEFGSVLASLGIWVGGSGGLPWDGDDRHDGVQRIVSNLAKAGIFVLHDGPLRVCPNCAAPRSPGRLVYRDELGPTYLVRFAVTIREREAHALAWVDAPWRVLGTSALLVRPDALYVLARYRRKDAEEYVVTSLSSLARLEAWIPGAEFEVIDQFPGRELQSLPYAYPLRHEFPMGGTLAAPAGTFQGTTEVSDTGTGIVPLVPGHGATDAPIAEKLGIPGWPLVTLRGRMDILLLHKYSGLDLRTADEFVIRDLVESGAIFAELKVRRGVPHCAICGTATVWLPCRTWCLEPGRLPPLLAREYARLLPTAPRLSQIEVAAWPVSESTTTREPEGITLRECNLCERLAPPDAPPVCPCGGRTKPVSRHLLPSIGGAIAGWARRNPLPPSDAIRLYLGDRRRAPKLVHHLTAIAGLDGPVGEIGLTLLPTTSAEDLTGLLSQFGADAVRAALLRTEGLESPSATLPERCAEERRRLERWWRQARRVLQACDPAMLAAFAGPMAASLDGLETLDRAFVARWERVRLRALAEFDRWSATHAFREVTRFLETDLPFYLDLVKGRLASPGSPPTKRAALRTLVHVLRGSTVLLAPIVPHTAEAIHRVIVPDRSSLFEEPPVAVDRSLLADETARAWERWRSSVRAVRRFLVRRGLARDTILPKVVLVLPNEEEAGRYRGELPVLRALLGASEVEIASPQRPWAGRRRELRPVDSEIQRVYPQYASQMVALLRRMPPRRAQASVNGDLSVVIGSNSYRIAPEMVGYVDLLPDRVVPAPWGLGEMYIELPADAGAGAANVPPLSPDAFWLVRRLARRLARAPPEPEGRKRVAIVFAADPLASELLQSRGPIARYLDLEELRVVTAVEEVAPAGRSRGRTRTGARWWFDVPGAPAGRRPEKHRAPRPRALRVPVGGAAIGAPLEDFASEEKIAEGEAIRSLGQELDSLLGVPLLGPSKVAEAWDVGLRSLSQYADAPFETLVALPGFGRPVAEALRRSLGREVPERPGRPARPPRPVVRVPTTVPSEEVLSMPDTPREAEPTPAPVGADSAAHVLPVADSGPPPAPEPSPAEADASARSDQEVPSGPAPPPPESVPTDTGATLELPGLPEATPIESAPDAPEPAAESPSPEPTPSAPDAAPGPEPSPSPPESPPPTPLDPEPLAADAAPSSSEPSAGATTPVAHDEWAGSGPSLPPADALPQSTPSQEDVPERSADVSAASASPEPAPTAPASNTELEPVSPELTPAPQAPGPEAEPALLDASGEPGPPTVPSESIEPSSVPEGPEPVPTDLPEPEPPIPPVAELGPPSPETSLGPTADPSPEGQEIGRSGPEGPPGDAMRPEPEPRTETGTPEAPGSGAMTEAEAPGPSESPVATTSELEPEAPSSAGPPASPGPGAEMAAPVNPPEEAAIPPAPEPPDEPTVPDLAPTLPAVPAPAFPAAEPPVAPQPTALPPPPTPPEPPIAPPALAPSPAGGIEIDVGKAIVPSLQPFLEATAAGHRGVCLVRESPERLRAHIGSRPVDIYWLSNLGRGLSLKPSDLEGIGAFWERSLAEDRVTAFYLEGIEYLVRLHGIDRVLDRLVAFDASARAHEARVWLHLNPDLIPAPDLERIRGTLRGTGAGSPPGAPN